MLIFSDCTILFMEKALFLELKAHQYCDNVNCKKYLLVGGSNIKTKTEKNGQIYCKSKPFSVRRGTMFNGLRTEIDKLISQVFMFTIRRDGRECGKSD
jgi:hypothetical protein